MKPMMILPPKLISAAHIKQLNDNGICVVEAKDPAKVRFVDPLPAASSRSEIERAAINLSRQLVNGQWGYGNNPPSSRSDFTRMFVDLLVSGTPLDVNGTVEEQRERVYNNEFREETARLARADAKAAREKRKAEEAKAAAKEADKS